MMTLNESYFNTPKRFRLEWQPGTDGYVHWYVDGQFRFGVEAEGLAPYMTRIPDEPSYIIMNTAISTSWGFPNPPFGCTEYDCKTTEGQCGMNPGFCKSLPAKFLIDSVRVYQNKEDPRQNVGCNPKDRPTRCDPIRSDHCPHTP
jgi:beta-glucan synthesis-associated protein KRE6